MTRLKIDFRLWDYKIELTLALSLQIKPRKYSAEKYVWHHFWKNGSCWCRSNCPKGSLKQLLSDNSQNSQANMCQNLFFFDKVKLYRSAASFKTRLVKVFYWEFWKFVRTPFLRNNTTRLLLIIAVTIVLAWSFHGIINEVRIGKRNCKF